MGIRVSEKGQTLSDMLGAETSMPPQLGKLTHPKQYELFIKLS